MNHVTEFSKNSWVKLKKSSEFEAGKRESMMLSLFTFRNSFHVSSSEQMVTAINTEPKIEQYEGRRYRESLF